MKNNKKLEKAFILLDDGTVFFGKALGVKGSAFGELCFNTGMTGYQEIFTDPSYYGQLMVTTNAHIGNYGVSDLDIESNSPKIAGLICKNFSYEFSRPLANVSLEDYLIKNELFGISDEEIEAAKNDPEKQKSTNFGPPKDGLKWRDWATGKSGQEVLKSSWPQDGP